MLPPATLWVGMPLVAILAAVWWLVRRQGRSSRSSAELIMAAFRSSPDAIIISRPSDGTLLHVNKGFEEITGYSPAEAVGKTTLELELWTPSDRARMVEAVRNQRRADKLEVSMRRKDGEYRECRFSTEALSFDGAPYLVTVAHDVSEQKAVERRLQASEQKFAKAFHSSPDAITITRLRDGTLLDVNEGFEQVSGYRAAEAVGKKTLDLGIWSAEDRAAVVEVLREEGRLHNREVSYRLRSGEVRDFLLAAEVADIEGEPCMVAVSRDVSERNEAEREREELISRLESQNAELERFAYTVSHELKSPLVTIAGYVGLVARHGAAGDVAEMRQGLERIRSATNSMKRHLDELLNLSRVGRAMNSPEVVSLTDLAQEAVQLLGSRLAVTQAVVEIPEDLPAVHADRTRLLEVMQNLIENAAKFSDVREKPRIEVGAREEDDEIVCWVRDDGIGIEPGFHHKVFRLFERLDRSIEGTGVGLALVQRIIEVHGGRIWIESEGAGRGTTVRFTLPREPRPSD